MKRRIVVWLMALIFITVAFSGLDYLVNEDRKTDPVKRSVQSTSKDMYNQYGLTYDAKLSSEPFYEDEEYIYYVDRLLNKFQYEDQYLENAEVILEKLQKIIPEDINQYFMPIPERIIWEEGYHKQKDAYNEFLENTESIIPDNMELLDVLPALSDHSDEYLFFRTYNGWTARGAYYGARMLCETMGIKPINLSGYEEHMYNVFNGTDRKRAMNRQVQDTEIYIKIKNIPSDPVFFYLLPGGKNRALRANIENGIEVTEKIQTVSKSRTGESAFVGGNYQWALVEGDGKDNEKKEQIALILCDSNGQLLIPYLSNYYKQVFVINLAFNRFSVEQFQQIFEEYNISDLVLAQSAEKSGDISKSPLLKKIYNMNQ